MEPQIPRPRWRIVVALGLPFATASLQWLVWDVIRPFAWFFFFPTVVLSAALGGFWAGIASTVLSCALVAYVFVPPELEWPPSITHVWSIIAFLGIGVLISYQQERVDRERRRAIESGEAKFQAIVEQTIAGIYIIQDGVFRYVNPHFAAMFGYDSPDEIVDRIPVADFVAEKDRPTTLGNNEDFVSGTLLESHHHVTGLRKDGSEFDFDIHWRSFEYKGRPAAIGIALDLSDTRRAQAEVEHLHEQMMIATRGAGMGVWEWNVRTDHIEWDDQMYRLYGLEPGSVDAYHGWRDALHPDDVARADQDTRDALIGARPYDTDFRIVLPDGRVRYIRTFGEVVRDSRGVPLRVVGINYDVTANREAAARERQYLQRLSSMAAQLNTAEERERQRLAVSLHDRVSQALAVAKMRLQTASEGHGTLGEELVIASLIDEALRETRAITSELYPPILTELGLPAALGALCEEFDRDTDLSCVANVDESIADLPADLGTVLYRTARELLMNTVKHSGAESVVLVLRRAGDDVELIVSDDGHGFDVSQALSDDSGGFGLFSIRDRIPHLGGRFDIQSSGRGTRAVITVPKSPRIPTEGQGEALDGP